MFKNFSQKKIFTTRDRESKRTMKHTLIVEPANCTRTRTTQYTYNVHTQLMGDFNERRWCVVEENSFSTLIRCRRRL